MTVRDLTLGLYAWAITAATMTGNLGGLVFLVGYPPVVTALRLEGRYGDRLDERSPN